MKSRCSKYRQKTEHLGNILLGGKFLVMGPQMSPSSQLKVPKAHLLKCCYLRAIESLQGVRNPIGHLFPPFRRKLLTFSHLRKKLASAPPEQAATMVCIPNSALNCIGISHTLPRLLQVLHARPLPPKCNRLLQTFPWLAVGAHNWCFVCMSIAPLLCDKPIIHWILENITCQ